MWEKEKFLLNAAADPTHYLLFLGCALCVWVIRNYKFTDSLNGWKATFILFSSLMSGFVSGASQGFSGFIFYTGFFASVCLSFISSVNAVGLTLILYICRPWEVLPANDWWSQVPRQCIWIWLIAWTSELSAHSGLLLRQVRFSTGVMLFLFFGAWCLLTTFASRNSAESLQYFVETLMRSMILVGILQLSARSLRDVMHLQFAFVTGAVTLALFSLWRFYNLDQTAPFHLLQQNVSDSAGRLEAVGSLGNSNDIAAVVLIPLGFLWVEVFARVGVVRRLMSLCVTVLLVKVLLSSQSRGALLAAGVQLALLLSAHSPRPKRTLLILVGLLASGGFFADTLMGRNPEDLNASTESRMNYYIAGLYMALNSPLWGQGFARFPYEFERFSPEILHEWGLRTAHSSWVLVLAETGFVGLVFFAVINFRVARSSWQLRRICPALLPAFAGYSIAILFLSHTWLMFPWILYTLVELSKSFSVPHQELLEA